jgi:hypothetical protein
MLKHSPPSTLRTLDRAWIDLDMNWDWNIKPWAWCKAPAHSGTVLGARSIQELEPWYPDFELVRFLTDSTWSSCCSVALLNLGCLLASFFHRDFSETGYSVRIGLFAASARIHFTCNSLAVPYWLSMCWHSAHSAHSGLILYSSSETFEYLKPWCRYFISSLVSWKPLVHHSVAFGWLWTCLDGKQNDFSSNNLFLL